VFLEEQGDKTLPSLLGVLQEKARDRKKTSRETSTPDKLRIHRGRVGHRRDVLGNLNEPGVHRVDPGRGETRTFSPDLASEQSSSKREDLILVDRVGRVNL